MIPLSAGDPLRLGPYRLLGALGEGGMGKVYYGRDNAGRKAAVKILRPELAHDQNLAQRFVREAQTAQAVSSSGVARVLGAQMEGGLPWIAAEFLAGPTLEEAVVAYGPMDEAGFRALAASIARTLQDIHAVGLVHRDLKPSNIVLTSSGPRIIDFGIARPEHGLTLTTTGQIPVTPGYGAPEQVLGQRVGPAADVFSLGAVLAVGGQRAYDGPHAAGVQYQVVHGEADLSQVPHVLRPLILPCLAKDPAHRPLPEQIARAIAPPRGADKIWRQGPLAADIARRETAATSLASTYTADRSAKPSRRRLLTLLGVGATVLAAGGGTTAWLLEDGQKTVAVPPATKAPTAPLLGPTESLTTLWGSSAGVGVRTPAPLPVRDVVLFEAADGGLTARKVTDGKQKWRAPDAVASAGYLTIADRLVVAVDGEGSLHAFIASTGEHAWMASGTTERLLAADAGAVYVMTRERQLRAVSVATRKVLWSIPTPVRTSGAEPPAAAAGKGRLVLFPADGNVIAVDTATGRTAWDLPNQGASALAPAVVNDKVYLGGRTLTARSLDDGNKLWSVPAEYGGWGPPAVRGDEVYAVDDELHRYRASDGKKQWRFYTGRNIGTRMPPAVQGGTAWITEPNDRGLIAASTRTGEEAFPYQSSGIGAYTMSGDGNRIFVAHAGSIAALAVRS